MLSLAVLRGGGTLAGILVGVHQPQTATVVVVVPVLAAEGAAGAAAGTGRGERLHI